MKNQDGFSLIEGLLVTIVLCVIVFAGYFVWSKQSTNSSDSSNAPVQSSNEDWDSVDETIQGLKEWSESLPNPEYTTELPGSSYLHELPLSIKKVYGVRYQASDVTKSEIEEFITSKGFTASDLIAPESSEYYAENTYTNQFLLCQATHSGINSFHGLSCVSLASYAEAIDQQSAILAEIESIKSISGIQASRLTWEKDDKNVRVDYELAGSSEYYPTIHLTRGDTDSKWTFVKEVDNSGQ